MTIDELRARARIDRGGYRVFDGEFAQMSVTLEDAEFLYALVRLVKPRRVLELGTGLGVSGRFIAEALAANGAGRLTTIEPNAEIAATAAALLEGTPSDVEVWAGTEWAQGNEDVGLVFIDSRYDLRQEHIRVWLQEPLRLPDVSPLVVVHDANREYAGLELGVGAFLPCSDGMWVGSGKA